MSPPDSDDAEIIKVDFAAPRVRKERPPPPFRQIHGSGVLCKHNKGFQIDNEARTIECATCHEVVNAFDAIVWYSKAWGEVGEEWDRLHDEIDIMEVDVDRLRRNKANVRRSKDGGATVVEVDPMEHGARFDAGVHLGNRVLASIRDGKPILFMPKVKT